MTTSELIKITAQQWDLNIDKLIENKRHSREYQDARKFLYNYLRFECNVRLRDIGRYFGNRNHSTVIFAIRKHDELYGSDSEYTFNCDNVLKHIA